MRVGLRGWGSRAPEAASAKFELIEQLVTTVKLGNFFDKSDFQLPPASTGFDPGAGI